MQIEAENPSTVVTIAALVKAPNVHLIPRG